MATPGTAARFLQDELPGIFRRGIEVLRQRADEGDPLAADRIDDVLDADGVAEVRLQGGSGDPQNVYLDARQGALTASTEPPGANRPRHAALALDADLADYWLEEVQRDAERLDDDMRAMGAAMVASRRAQTATEREPLRFHVHVKGVPDLGDRTIAVVLGVDEPPPERPAFAVTLDWSVIEDLRDEEITPQQLFTGGKLRFSGDYARALSLGMQLAQRAERAQRGR